jgi:hypothetical protein
MKRVGIALLLALALAGCTATEAESMPASPSDEADAPTAAPPPPTATPSPTATPAPVDPELAAALHGAATATSMIGLVESGDLEAARQLVAGADSPLDWQPTGTPAWADEYTSLAETRFWYLQLFDDDGPSEEELARWLAVTESSLAAFQDAVEPA